MVCQQRDGPFCGHVPQSQRISLELLKNLLVGKCGVCPRPAGTRSIMKVLSPAPGEVAVQSIVNRLARLPGNVRSFADVAPFTDKPYGLEPSEG